MNDVVAQPSNDFYSQALQRIQVLMIALGLAALMTSAAVFGWRTGMGFGIGASVSFLNFYWLKKVVAGVAALTIRKGSPVSSRRIVQRFLLRYFLMALAAFVILTVSRESLYGFFAGLFLPVAAMLCEAVYEAFRVVAGR